MSLKSPLASFRELRLSSLGAFKNEPSTKREQQPNLTFKPRLDLLKFLNAAILSISAGGAGAGAGAALASQTAIPPSKAPQISVKAYTSGTTTSYRLSDALSGAAQLAIGDAGLERLRVFEQLNLGWDGVGSLPMQASSIALFDRFLKETGITPPGASVFMSSYGELILAWQDREQFVTELKFQTRSVECYREADSLHINVEPKKFVNLAELLDVPRHAPGATQLYLNFSSGSRILASLKAAQTTTVELPKPANVESPLTSSGSTLQMATRVPAELLLLNT